MINVTTDLPENLALLFGPGSNYNNSNQQSSSSSSSSSTSPGLVTEQTSGKPDRTSSSSSSDQNTDESKQQPHLHTHCLYERICCVEDPCMSKTCKNNCTLRPSSSRTSPIIQDGASCSNPSGSFFIDHCNSPNCDGAVAIPAAQPNCAFVPCEASHCEDLCDSDHCSDAACVDVCVDTCVDSCVVDTCDDYCPEYCDKQCAEGSCTMGCPSRDVKSAKSSCDPYCSQSFATPIAAGQSRNSTTSISKSSNTVASPTVQTSKNKSTNNEHSGSKNNEELCTVCDTNMFTSLSISQPSQSSQVTNHDASSANATSGNHSHHHQLSSDFSDSKQLIQTSSTDKKYQDAMMSNFGSSSDTSNTISSLLKSEGSAEATTGVEESQSPFNNNKSHYHHHHNHHHSPSISSSSSPSLSSTSSSSSPRPLVANKFGMSDMNFISSHGLANNNQSYSQTPHIHHHTNHPQQHLQSCSTPHAHILHPSYPKEVLKPNEVLESHSPNSFLEFCAECELDSCTISNTNLYQPSTTANHNSRYLGRFPENHNTPVSNPECENLSPSLSPYSSSSSSSHVSSLSPPSISQVIDELSQTLQPRYSTSARSSLLQKENNNNNNNGNIHEGHSHSIHRIPNKKRKTGVAGVRSNGHHHHALYCNTFGQSLNNPSSYSLLRECCSPEHNHNHTHAHTHLDPHHAHSHTYNHSHQSSTHSTSNTNCFNIYSPRHDHGHFHSHSTHNDSHNYGSSCMPTNIKQSNNSTMSPEFMNNNNHHYSHGFGHSHSHKFCADDFGSSYFENPSNDLSVSTSGRQQQHFRHAHCCSHQGNNNNSNGNSPHSSSIRSESAKRKSISLDDYDIDESSSTSSSSAQNRSANSSGNGKKLTNTSSSNDSQSLFYCHWGGGECEQISFATETDFDHHFKSHHLLKSVNTDNNNNKSHNIQNTLVSNSSNDSNYLNSLFNASDLQNDSASANNNGANSTSSMSLDGSNRNLMSEQDSSLICNWDSCNIELHELDTLLEHIKKDHISSFSKFPHSECLHNHGSHDQNGSTTSSGENNLVKSENMSQSNINDSILATTSSSSSNDSAVEASKNFLQCLWENCDFNAENLDILDSHLLSTHMHPHNIDTETKSNNDQFNWESCCCSTEDISSFASSEKKNTPTTNISLSECNHPSATSGFSHIQAKNGCTLACCVENDCCSNPDFCCSSISNFTQTPNTNSQFATTASNINNNSIKQATSIQNFDDYCCENQDHQHALKNGVSMFQCEWKSCTYQSSDFKDFMGHVRRDHVSKAILSQNGLGSANERFQIKTEIKPEEYNQNFIETKTSPDSKLTNFQVGNDSKFDGIITKKDPQLPTPPEVSPIKSKAPAIKASSSSSLITKKDKDSNSDSHICKWLIPNKETGELEPCNKVYANTVDLSEHVVDTHVGSRKPQYTCLWENCDRHTKPFSQRQKIIRHLQTHTKNKPFKCDICGNSFAEESVLKQHLRIHSGEKPFECKICGKRFAASTALSVHLRVHTGDKPLKCKWPGCNKRFSESSNLAKHMKTHMAEKPYACTVPGCTKKFGRNDQLQRHLKTHANKIKTDSSEKKEQQETTKKIVVSN